MDLPDASEGRRYHVLEALGKGGFGTVYRAQLQSTGGFRKPVALKVLNPDVEGMDEIVGRLRDEARMLGMLRHNSIVQVDGLVFLDGRWTVVMEYVEGASLNQLLSGLDKLPPKVALAICQDVAGALDTAYARPTRDGEAMGLLHRDIKPGNIQVTPLGEVKLLDFGVARANMERREAKTQAVIYGSLPYMSPERYELTDKHQSDIYALTATLIECITGDQMGRANLHPDRFDKQVAVELDKVRALCDNDALIDFLRRGMSYEWVDRPDARQFERECRELVSQVDGPWLKDWAEHTVTDLVGSRDPENDELSGKVLTESTSAGHALADLPEQADATDESLWADPNTKNGNAVDQPPPPPPQPGLDEPAAPEAPTATKQGRGGDEAEAPARRRKKGGSSIVKYFVIFLLLVILGGLGLIIAAPVLGMGGLAILCAPFWGEAVVDTNRESFAELRYMVETTCVVSSERDALIGILDQGQLDASKRTIGLFEMSNFELRVEDAVEDGQITAVEVQIVRDAYDNMVRD